MSDTRKMLPVAAGMILLAASSGAIAHHSVAAQFDTDHNVTAVGVLTRAELVNPHSYLHFDIKDASGKVEQWSFETGAPAALKVMGLSMRDTFKTGETYKLVYSPPRSKGASKLGLLSAIVLPDGRLVAFGAKNNVDAGRDAAKK